MGRRQGSLLGYRDQNFQEKPRIRFQILDVSDLFLGRTGGGKPASCPGSEQSTSACQHEVQHFSRKWFALSVWDFIVALWLCCCSCCSRNSGRRMLTSLVSEPTVAHGWLALG